MISKNTIKDKILIEIAKAGEYPYSYIDKITDNNRRMIVRNLKALIDDGYVKKRKFEDIKTIKLTKKGLEYIADNYEDIYKYYMDITYNHKSLIGSNYRKMVKTAKCKKFLDILGVAIIPNEKIKLTIRDTNDYLVEEDNLFFYESREIKSIDRDIMKKVDYTRSIGVLFENLNITPVYHVGSSPIAWSNQGEMKMNSMLRVLGNKNIRDYNNKDIEKAFFLCDNINNVSTFLESEKIKWKKNKNTAYDIFTFDNVFKEMYFIPVDDLGLKILYFLIGTDYKKIIDVFLYSDINIKESFNIDCDYIDDENYYHFNILDFDYSKLKRLKNVCTVFSDKNIKLHCFDIQEKVVEDFLKGINNVYVDVYMFDSFYELI